jgi:hypothetical protein
MFCTKLHRSGRNVPQGEALADRKAKQQQIPFGDDNRTKTADPCGMTTRKTKARATALT